jgi:hypothetical protein
MLAAMPRQTGITPERNDLFTVLALIEGGRTCLGKGDDNVIFCLSLIVVLLAF